MNDRAENHDVRIPRPLAAMGILIGGCAAVGVPWAALASGADSRLAVILSIVGLFGGLALILLSVLFRATAPARRRSRDDTRG